MKHAAMVIASPSVRNLTLFVVCSSVTPNFSFTSSMNFLWSVPLVILSGSSIFNLCPTSSNISTIPPLHMAKSPQACLSNCVSKLLNLSCHSNRQTFVMDNENLSIFNSAASVSASSLFVTYPFLQTNIMAGLTTLKPSLSLVLLFFCPPCLHSVLHISCSLSVTLDGLDG